MLLCIEYGILFVDTVDTKIKACNALNAMFFETMVTFHLYGMNFTMTLVCKSRLLDFRKSKTLVHLVILLLMNYMYLLH